MEVKLLLLDLEINTSIKKMLWWESNDYKNSMKRSSEDKQCEIKCYKSKTHKSDTKQQTWIKKLN